MLSIKYLTKLILTLTGIKQKEALISECLFSNLAMRQVFTFTDY